MAGTNERPPITIMPARKCGEIRLRILASDIFNSGTISHTILS